MAVMTTFRTREPDNQQGQPLAQIPWKGLNNEHIPPGGYSFQPSHILMQKEILGYLAAKPGGYSQHQALTDTARSLYENVAQLFSEHKLPLAPLGQETTIARGKSEDSALEKFAARFNKPLLNTKPLTDMVGITLIFPNHTDMGRAINLLRAAFPTDDVIRLDNGEIWETFQDGRNAQSSPLYRCRKVYFVYAPGQIAEAQLMTESEYEYAKETDCAYHEQTHVARTVQSNISPDVLRKLRAAMNSLQDVTEPQLSELLGMKIKPPGQGR